MKIGIGSRGMLVPHGLIEPCLELENHMAKTCKGLHSKARPYKTCTCCQRAFNLKAWKALPLVGRQEDGRGGFLTLKNCTCNSTLAVTEAA